MTTHIYGEDSYVECDRFHVVNISPYEDYKEKFRPEHQCYCGADCVQQVRVAFVSYKREKGNRRPWPESISTTYKAHRCEEHRFEETDV